MATTPSQSKSVTVLFASSGRRVELMQAFRAAAESLGMEITIVAADYAVTAPTAYVADVFEPMPLISSDAYLPTLLAAAERRGANLLVPTIDTDLSKISAARDAFDAVGCTALIGPPAAIENSGDKIRTYEFLTGAGVDTPQTYTADAIRAAHPGFPLLLKPRAGSASQSVRKIRDQRELEFYLDYVDDPIVQEFVEGIEYTLDAYVGLSGEVRCIVPRRRLQVRGGEVCKGITVKDPAIMAAGKRVVEALGPGLRGLVTLQCIVTPAGRIRFIEINARFGGGAPLGIAAGADYPKWLLQEWRGEKPNVAFDAWRDQLCMYRYDWAVFAPENAQAHPDANVALRQPPAFK